MKLGILGGSFNPIHLGHLFLADNAFCHLGLDRLVFIPACYSPFKVESQSVLYGKNAHSTSNDRLDMLAAAIEGDNRFAIDNCEIKREGVSYTIDTLDDIISRYMPSEKPYLIIGDDLAADFPKWRESERILQLAHIVIARRENAKINVSYPYMTIENDVMTASSKSVRQLIEQGGSWRSLVPAGVRAIIEDRGLYGYTKQGKAETSEAEHEQKVTQADILRIEAVVRK